MVVRVRGCVEMHHPLVAKQILGPCPAIARPSRRLSVKHPVHATDTGPAISCEKKLSTFKNKN